MSEKRDLKADLEEWHSDLIHGTGKTDWFYLVENYINRAIEAEAELSALRGCNSLLEEVLRQKVLLLDEIAELRQNLSADAIGLQKIAEVAQNTVKSHCIDCQYIDHPADQCVKRCEVGALKQALSEGGIK